MAYEVPTLAQLMQFSTALFRGMLPTRNVRSQFSFYWKLIKTFAGATTDVHAHVDSAAKNAVPWSATGAAQDEWLSVVKLKRLGATPSRKAKAGRVTGTVGNIAHVGDQLTHRASGNLFQINSTVTIPASGFVDADILAISVGSSTRLLRNEVLEYVIPIGGISAQVVLQLDLDEDGQDQESEGAAKIRLLIALAAESSGGNQQDYVRWTLSSPVAVAHAYCYPNRAGLGTVDIVALHAGVGSSRSLTLGERATLLAYLQTLAPAPVAINSAVGTLRILNTRDGSSDALNLANVEITISPNTDGAYQFDWDQGASPPVVLTYNPASLTVQFTAARPVTMQAGHRICFRGVASLQDGAFYTIDSLVGADSIVLQTAPAVSPVATDIVYSGSPIAVLVRDAIVAHINSDTLYAGKDGPISSASANAKGINTVPLSTLLDGIGPANSLGVYGGWVGSLLRGSLSTVVQATRGVRNHVVITPAADQDAQDYPYPDDASIGVLSVGYILIRSA